MLETLDSVPWSKLGHAYGSASDVPALIRMLTSSRKEEREEAVHELFGNIYHQGSIYEATEHAVPFLIELLQEPKVKCKEDILMLLLGFVMGVDFLEADGRLVLDEDCAQSPRSPYQELVYGVYLAVCKGITTYVGFLADRSPRIRAAAVSLLGYCAGKRRSLYGLICERFEAERSAMVRAHCVFAVGVLKSPNRRNLQFFKGVLQSADPALRLWAAIGLVRSMSDSLPDTAYEAIYDGIVSCDSYDDSKTRVLWSCMSTADVCCRALSSRKQDAAKAVEILLRALKDTSDGWTAYPVVRALLELTSCGKRITKKAAVEHRLALQVIAASDAFWHVYERHIADGHLEKMLKGCTGNCTQKELKAFLRSLDKETSRRQKKPTGESAREDLANVPPSVMAMISQRLFPKDCRTTKGNLPGLGDIVPLKRYASANANLKCLSQGGDLYLVTVRPGEELWLVGVLRSPQFSRNEWLAGANEIPVTDISSIKHKLRFASGTGISAKKGALGMSLQTPRTLTAEDVGLLNSTVRGFRTPIRRRGR